MNESRCILITGGAGFIGSHTVRRMVKRYPHYKIVNLDALTYAGNLENLKDIETQSNYHFERANIEDASALERIFAEHKPDGVIHLAAESHVDRSIKDPLAFVRTNVLGTVNLLNVALAHWKDFGSKARFYHVSTDEVYGSLGAEGLFREDTAYDPRSPYSASKASSDHFVRAYFHTYGLPVVLSNCSNNYGPYQFPEKLLPLMIRNIWKGSELPVYGDGKNVRDWLWVEDHAAAIDLIFHEGKNGETYNIGGNNEMQNIEIVHMLCDLMDGYLSRPQGKSRELIRFVKDRPGHDKRYAIDAGKIKRELGWEPSMTREQGLRATIEWYLANEAWLERVTSGAYQDYYRAHYG